MSKLETVQKIWETSTKFFDKMKDDEKKETIGIEYLGGYQATLYVHASDGVVDAYKRHWVWNKFADIKPFKNYR